jgi:hypothetical protein
MSEGTRKSPMDEAPQSVMGEAILQRARENCRRAYVIRGAARAARQCATEVQEEARSACTLARAAGMVHRHLITQLHSHVYGRSAMPRTTRIRVASGELCRVDLPLHA